jgi:lipoprotein-releasing system permease protein
LPSLPFPAYLALRYLKSTRKDSFVTFLSAVAGGGLALGVAALILALGALSGFQAALRGEILARTPQLEVELGAAAVPQEVRQRLLAVAGIRGAQLVARGRGWLVSDGRVAAVEVVGYEGDLPTSFAANDGARQGVFVSDALAARWGLRPGDALEAVSARPTLSPLGPRPRARMLALAGTYRGGRSDREERVAVPLAVAGALLGDGDRRFELDAGGLTEALRVLPAVRAVLPELRVRSWDEINRPLFFALRLEKAVMFVAVFLIVLVAALALIADLALVIAAKRGEIGMLGAMGAAPRRLARAFLLLGALLAGGSAAVGTGLGVGAALLMDRFRLLRLPRETYFLDYVPFEVHGSDLGVVVVGTLLLALACSWYAARRVANLAPLEALRP